MTTKTGQDQFTMPTAQPKPARRPHVLALAAYALLALCLLAFFSTTLFTTAIRLGQLQANGETYCRLLLLTYDGPGYLVIAFERPRPVMTWGEGRRGWDELSRQLTEGSTLNWRRLGVWHSSDDDQAPHDSPRTMTVVNWMYVLAPAGAAAWLAHRGRRRRAGITAAAAPRPSRER